MASTPISTRLLPSLASGGRPLVVQVARLAEIKHQATTIEAVGRTKAQLALIGGAQPGSAVGYERRLRDLIRRLELEERCRVHGRPVPAAEARDWYRRATVAVNMSPPGLFDKAALESMACGVPTIVCNPAFTPLLGDLCRSAADRGAGGCQRLKRAA